MKRYLCDNNERKGSCYLEFRKADKKGVWLDDSKYISDDLAVDDDLHNFIINNIKDFDSYSALSEIPVGLKLRAKLYC